MASYLWTGRRVGTSNVACLRIWSDTLSPHEITQTLGIEPTKTGDKGKQWSKGKGVHRKNLWILHSKLEFDVTIEDHIRRFARLLEEKAARVDNLLNSPGTSIEIMCEFSAEGNQYPMTLEPELLTMLSRFSVTLHLTPWNHLLRTDLTNQ